MKKKIQHSKNWKDTVVVRYFDPKRSIKKPTTAFNFKLETDCTCWRQCMSVFVCVVVFVCTKKQLSCCKVIWYLPRLLMRMHIYVYVCAVRVSMYAPVLCAFVCMCLCLLCAYRHTNIANAGSHNENARGATGDGHARLWRQRKTCPKYARHCHWKNKREKWVWCTRTTYSQMRKLYTPTNHHLIIIY